MWCNYHIHNWGKGCELTRCHIHLEKKIVRKTDTLDAPDNSDIVVFSGRKWGEWYIKL